MLSFEGVRVVEIGSGTALAFCGKIFADFGAEVVKIEPPGGAPERQHPPLVDIGGGHRESGYFAWLNTNKKSVTADLQNEADLARVRAIMADSDIVLDARALGPDGLQADLQIGRSRPGQTEVRFTWFGDSGPYREFHATEAVARALAGVIHLTGPAEGPPYIPHDTQSGITVGLAAFATAAAGYLGRGQGAHRYVLSVQEALLHIIEMDIGLALAGRGQPRLGINRFGGNYPASIYPTTDGNLGIFVANAPQWRGLCKVLGRPELGTDPNFADGAQRIARAEEIDAIITPIVATRPASEWFQLAMKERLPVVIVPTMEQLLKQEVHRERGAFVPVRIGEANFEGPTLAQRLGQGGPLPGGRAPLAGEHNACYATDHETESSAITDAVPSSGKPPLAGMRVIDLTMGWAGPFAARHLADMGAEVIKVESISYPDWWRGMNFTDAFYAEKEYEKSGHFNMMNRNKLGITLDLTTKQGIAIFKEMVATADALIENYSAEVLPKLGLQYSVLSEINPRLVMVSMPAFGSNNAWSNTRAYGGTLEQACGLPMVSGREDWPPTMSSYAYGDPMGGFNATASLLAGLAYRQKTGSGCLVDLSQIEGMLSLVAPSIIEQSAHGKVGPRLGNRHPRYSPHGCFRCKGDDDWIVIAVANDAQWKSLCRVMGRSDLAQDAALETVSGRRKLEDEIEAAIEQWTREHSADHAMNLLQAGGVPAGVARTPGRLPEEPHLVQSGFWRVAERPFPGVHLQAGTFFRENGKPAPIRNPAPTLGQHNRRVLHELFGIEEERLAELEARGIIGTQAVRKKASAK
jgi:crotonobetainyl-CoA:carnitine CoA-transferase CaiB-like acyl-CoA transferase